MAKTDKSKGPPGVVRTLGPLVDDAEKAVSGKTRNDGAKVTLFVNDIPVVTTHSHGAGKTGGQFYLRCHELADYLGDGDTISLRDVTGACLTIGKDATAHVVSNGRESQVEALKAQLEQGYVFTKFGRLSPGWTPQRKQAARRLFEAVADELKRTFDHDLMPAYGNLLGAVREGDFIVHDAGLFDTIYLSRHEEPALVVDEAIHIVKHLVDAGFAVKGAKSCTVYITSPSDRSVALDFSWAWFDSEGEFDISVGSRFRKSRDREGYHDFANAFLGDWPIRVPGNAEEILFQLYGENWRIPDQGLRTGERLTRNELYLFSDEQLAQIVELRKLTRRRS
ncbi:MAG: hypothetical protein ACXIVG_00265 [Pararhodobacter sp.]